MCSSAEITRLTITWSKNTDLALRSYLGSQGLKESMKNRGRKEFAE